MLYTSNGKLYWQDLGDTRTKGAAFEVSEGQYQGQAQVLPSGVTTVPFGSAIDFGGGKLRNVQGKGLVEERLSPRYTLEDVGVPGGSSFLESEKAKMYGEGGVFGERGAVDEAAIREQKRKDAQVQLDAINEIYNRLAQGEAVQGEDRLGRARAIASRAGLVGSTFYEQGQKPAVEKQNRDIQASIEAERSLKLAAVFDKIDQRAVEEVQAEKERRRGNAEKYLQFLTDAQAGAREDISTLAESGVPLDELSDDEYKNLLKYGGFKSDLELETYYNSKKEKAAKIDYQYRIEGNKILAIGVDPKTGQLKVQEQTLDLPTDQLKGREVKEVDGELWLVDKATGEAKKIGGQKNPNSDFKNLPNSYQEWSLAGKPGTYAEWVKKNDSSNFFRPSPEEKSAAIRWTQKNGGTEEDVKKLEEDSNFFYGVLQKAIDENMYFPARGL